MKKQNLFRRIFTKKRITTEDYAQIADETTPPPKLNIGFADSRRIILSGLLIIAVFFGIGG
ncbi:MAG: hypothetical protein U9R29_08025, partial [Thermodesulfobacteriota bacterium]|nr:hypothetical protein [Thermodesulfobacteriota bacterium]